MLHELGHGAYGTVFLVRHKRLNTLRAVKFIKSSIRNKDYLNEANLLKNLKHSGIPIIYDIEEDNEGIYVIEEYIDGNTLSELICGNGKFRLRQACEITIQLCEILEFLHENKECPIAHLDLKPDNVMIDKSNKVKLIDFGSSAVEGGSVKACMGSRFFAAPEQYHRLKPDRMCDIYAMGMLLLFMLTGKHEWSGIEEIPSAEISGIIKKCVRHNPRQRYQSAKRIGADIKKILKKQLCENSKLSLKINLIGIKRGAGTTHIALALTHFFTRREIKAVYTDNTGGNRIYDFLDKAKLCSNAAYSMFGIYMLPDYKGCVELTESWEITVCDCGDTVPSDCKGAGCVNLIVGSAKEHEKAFFEKEAQKIIKMCGQSDKTAVILNHMSGRQYYDYLNGSCREKGIKIFRMPCKYDWHVPDAMSDSVFESIMEEYVPAGIIHRHKNFKKRRMIFESIQRIFRKIIGRTRQSPF